MKKLFYGLGAIAAAATPVVAVISCGSNGESTTPTFTTVTDTKTLETNVLEGFRALRAKIAQAPIGQKFTLVNWQDHLATNDNLYIPLSPVFDNAIVHDQLETLLKDTDENGVARKFETVFGSDVDRVQTFKAKIDTSKLAGTPDATLVVAADTTVAGSIQEVNLSMHLPTFDVRDGDSKKVLIAYSGLDVEIEGHEWRHIKTTYFTGKGYTLPTELKVSISTQAKKTEILNALDAVVAAVKALVK